MTGQRLAWHFLPAFLGAIGFVLACLIWSFAWIDRPFPGFFVDADGRVEGQQFMKAAEVVSSPVSLDLITACDGIPMPDGDAVYRYVASKPPGTTIRYRVVRDFGRITPQILAVDLPCRRFRLDEWLAFVPVYWLDGLIHILLGAFVLCKRPSDQAALAHWFFCLALGLFLAAIPESLMGHHLVGAHFARITWTAGNAWIGTTSFSLAMWVPRPWPVTAGRPGFHRWQMWAGGMFVGLLTLIMGVTGRIEWEIGAFCFAFIGTLAISSAALWTRISRHSSDVQVRSANVILWGFALAFLPAPLISLLHYIGLGATPRQEWAEFALLCAPASVAYAILRHQLFDIPRIIRRTTQYALLTAALGAVYAGVVASGTALFGRLAVTRLSEQSAALLGALAVAFTFRPLQTFLRRRLDRFFLGERANDLHILTAVSQIVPSDPATVADALLDLVESAFQPAWSLIQTEAGILASRGDVPAAAAQGHAHQVPSGVSPMTAGVADAPDGSLAVPLPSPVHERGWLLLGPRRNDMPYAAEAYELLRALASQGAVTLANAKAQAAHTGLLIQEQLARAQAEERRRVLRQILHDQRTDLMNIALAVDLVGKLPDSQYAVTAIRDSVTRMERFLNDKTTPDGGGGVRAGIAAAIRTTARLFADQIRQRAQTLAVTLPPAEWTVALTPVELEQILTNLVDNASKHAPSRTAIRLDARRDGGGAVIAVHDEGPGIPDALLDQLGSGHRADPTLPGFGFGLQNVRDLATKAGGTLSWRNVARGAVVEVWLPLQGL